MTLTQFRIRFPEFARASDVVVSAALDAAAQVTNPTVWGGLLAEGIGYRAADDLARSPNARDMKLIAGDGSTLYSMRLSELKRTVAIGIRAV